MRERGMIFNAEMVRAILNGSKTQTRRPVKSPIRDINFDCELSGNELAGELSAGNYQNSVFGKPGDRIWVRETYRVMSCATDVARLMYKASERNSFTESTRTVPVATCTKQPSESWTPSIHMPRWASRILLEITSVRVEKLKHVPRAGIIAEGYPAERAADGGGYEPFLWYRDLWESIYGDGSWQANPWVWVIEFKRVEASNV